MLESLRNAAASWVAKIFIGLLVLSFAVWGIADIFGNYGADSVAEVGETEVSAAAFQSAYQRELSQVANQLGRQLSPDESRALGIDRRVLSDMITTATLVNHARTLGLGVSDDYIANEIAESPEFRDAFGRFDRNRFHQLLAANGLTEPDFVAQTRNRSVRNQISATVAGSAPAPDVLVDALNEFQNGMRVVDYFTVPPVDPATIEDPSADELSRFYDSNKPRFTEPEFRHLSVLELSPEELIPTVSVTEDEIEEQYRLRQSQYETPERRELDQLVFPSTQTERAAEAYAKIEAGAEFAEVAAEYGFAPSDIDLGLVERSELVDEDIAEAAFSLDEGEVSEPIQGLLGTAIVRVRDVRPGSVRSLDEVRDEISRRIALERAREEAIDLYETVEDERAAGLTLEEVAGKLGLRHEDYERVARSGTGPDGEPVAGLPENPELLRVAFESDVGLENDPIDAADGGFLWVDVREVVPPQLKPYDQVAAEVERLWREDRLAEALRDKAQSLVDRGREGATVAGLAEDLGQSLRTSEPFQRGSASAPFDNGLVQAIFAAPVGGLVRGHAREGESLVVAQVREAVPAEPVTGEAAAPLRDSIVAALEADLFEQYVTGLQSRYGISINTNTLGVLTGTAEP